MTPHLSLDKPAPALEAFLFAPIGEERNGMTLSVLSGLSRLDIDPWDEAARLSRLPTDAAIAALAQLIARLPRGAWQLSDATGIAVRLVELLPRDDGRALADPLDAAADSRQSPVTRLLWLVAAGVALSLLLGVPGRIERWIGADSVVAPVVMPADRSSPGP
jgi:hypothetical protein